MELKKIESFKVNHTDLLPGLYVSRIDRSGECVCTTFDIRMKAPNREPVMSTGVMHTIEHLGATYMRNSALAEKTVYFGPMGCRTGFYLVLFGEHRCEDVAGTVSGMFRFIAGFSGDVPGASPEECGNWSDQDPEGARGEAASFLKELEQRRFVYPESRS